MNRPKIVTIIALFFLLSIPLDLITVVAVGKSSYIESMKNHEALIRDGKITYKGTIVYWDKQSEGAKQRIINDLNMKKKIMSNFFLFMIFKWLFVILNILLVYGLWHLKKYVPIVLSLQFVLYAFFSLFFSSLSLTSMLVFGVLDLIILVVVILWAKNYFIY